MKLLKNNKGFSVVEVVIAMVVVSLVTATALSILSLSAAHSKTTTYKIDAQYLVSDAVECFKVSDTADEFYDALVFRGGWVGANRDGENYSFILEKSGYAVLVSTDYENNESSFLNLVIRILDPSDPDNSILIAEGTYQKSKEITNVQETP